MFTTKKYWITGLLGLATAITWVASSWAERPHHRSLPIDLSELSQRMDERFASADADADGLLSPTEFSRMEPLRGHKGHRFHGRRHHRDGIEDRDTRKARRAEFEAELFTAMDTDGNGQLSAEEASHDNRHKHAQALHQEKRFARLDANNNGFLERAEFDERLTRMQALDTDKDGTVSREELRRGRGTDPRMHPPAETS